MIDRKKETHKNKRLRDTPVISVALLVKNGLPRLRLVLEKLTQQKLPVPYEIVALDSGSSDGSRELMERLGVQVAHLDPEEFRFGPARELCFSLTRGKVIVTLSQDAVPEDDQWLWRMAEHVLDGRCDIVQGTTSLPEHRIFAWEHYSKMHFTRLYRDLVPEGYDLSCVSLAVSREAWLKTGFGTVQMSEDKVMAIRAAERGLRIGVEERSKVLHGHSYTLRSLMKRCFNEGLGARQAGSGFGLRRMLAAMARADLWLWLLWSAVRGRIRTPAEVLFLLVRPVMLFAGSHFGRNFWR